MNTNILDKCPEIDRTSVFSIVGFFVLVVGLWAGIATYFVAEDVRIRMCKERTVATITNIETIVTEARHKNGEAYSHYKHTVTYEFSIGDSQYTFDVIEDVGYENSMAPKHITVRYNHKNPDVYYVDTCDLVDADKVYVVTDRGTGKVLPDMYILGRSKWE